MQKVYMLLSDFCEQIIEYLQLHSIKPKETVVSLQFKYQKKIQ